MLIIELITTDTLPLVPRVGRLSSDKASLFAVVINHNAKYISCVERNVTSMVQQLNVKIETALSNNGLWEWVHGQPKEDEILLILNGT